MTATLRIHREARFDRVVCRLLGAPGRRSSRRSVTATIRRRGVSLLEVLIAVFVLTFGLMSVAMVIPAGRALMVEAAKSDRATACGRAALDHVQVRGWYDPTSMYEDWGTLGFRSTIHGNGLLYGETYFLDPLFFVYDPDPFNLTPGDPTQVPNSEKDSVRHFPYSPYPEREFSLSGSAPRLWPDRARARRVTFNRTDFSGVMPIAAPLPEAFARQLTTWADELKFSLESDGKRPRQMFSWVQFDPSSPSSPPTVPSEFAVSPVMVGDEFDPTNKLAQDADSERRFTWAVMITPIVPITYQGTFNWGGGLVPRVDSSLIQQWDNGGAFSPPIPVVNAANVTRCEISIVVFYNRNFYCPEGSGDTNVDELRTVSDVEKVRERSVYAQLIGGGVGGGDVYLFVPDGDDARPVGYLNVKKNDWIMLKGLDRAGFVGNHGALAPDYPNCPTIPVRPTVCKWYRVVSVDDVEYGKQFPNPVDFSQPLLGRRRLVTLAGPDWEVDTTYNTTTGNTPPFDSATDIAEAALVDNVAGVYTTIVDVTAQ